MDYNQESPREIHTLPTLSKTVSVIVIIREPVTLLNAWLTKENADFMHPLTYMQNAIIDKIFVFGIALLVSAIIFFRDRTYWSLGFLSAIFIIETYYQFIRSFFEAFYFITSPVIFILLSIIWVYSPRKAKMEENSGKSEAT